MRCIADFSLDPLADALKGVQLAAICVRAWWRA